MKYGKRVALVAATAALVAGACGSSSKSTGAAGTTAAATATTVAAGGATTAAAAGGKSLVNGLIKCDQQYKGKEVHIFSPVRDGETDKAATRLRDAYKPLEDCTGVKVVYDGTDQFETEVKVKFEGGNAPDIADFPQPGGFLELIAKGQLKPLPADIGKMVTDTNLAGWPELATVSGKVYGVPARANVKSMVWYSPAMFKAKGYAIPKTLDELKALSDKMAADGSGATPWCVGIESGVATGWVITDWFEDFMLRINGIDVYDQWVQHKIPFNDPKVKAVAEAVASYVKNPAYIGGDNAIKAIASTKFQEGGFPILQNKCYMHKQASFYSTIWAKGTTIGADNQVNYFYLPMKSASDKKAMLGGGDLLGAGNDKPETFAVLAYTGSTQYQTDLVKAGDTSLSTLKDFDTTAFTDPVIKSFADLLKASDVFRFDGADMMPPAVGSGTFWTEATQWILGQDTTDQMLNNIETSWPKK